MNIDFHFLKKADLKNRNRLKSFIKDLVKMENKKIIEITYIICSDRHLLEINKKFLSHNYNTDIITFDLSTDHTNKIGEIYISVDRVKVNAKEYNEFIYKELHRVIFHGVLHLCGYEDKTKKDASIMREKEDYYLSKYFKN